MRLPSENRENGLNCLTPAANELYRVNRRTVYLLRHLLILVKLVGHDNEVRAPFLGFCNEHAGPDAKLSSLIVGRGDFSSALCTVRVADSQGFALERWLCKGGN